MALKKNDVFAEALLELQARVGLVPPSRPQGDPPTIEGSVADLSDEEIMDIWSQLTAWADHISVHVAEAHSREKSMQKRIEALEQTYILSSGKVTVARAEAKTSPEMSRLVGEWLRADAYKSLMSAMANNIERDIQLLSRELTRRTSSANAGRRASWSA